VSLQIALLPSVIGIDDEFNLYAYVRNDPVVNVDSTGGETQLAVGGRTDDNPFGHVAGYITMRRAIVSR
jgi:uncharacterized protein RhaS with RHS repeats